MLDIFKIGGYSKVEREVKMNTIEKITYETEIKIQELKEILEIVKQYPTKEVIQMALEGRLDGFKSFLKAVKDE